LGRSLNTNETAAGKKTIWKELKMQLTTNRTTLTNRLVLLCAIAGVSPLASSALAAPNHTWTGAGNNGLITSAANWSDNIAPTTGTIYRGGSLEQLIGNTDTITVPSTIYLGSSTAYAAALTLDSSTLTTIEAHTTAGTGLGKFLVFEATGTPVLTLGSTVGAGDTAQTITIASGASNNWITQVQITKDTIFDITNANATLNIAAALQSGGGFEKKGAGKVILSNTTTSNSFGGTGKTILITAGTVSVASSQSLGNASNTMTLNGGTLQFAAPAFSTARALVVNATGGTVDVSGAQGTNDITLTTALTGSNPFTKTGAARLTLNPGTASTYNGTITVKQGVLNVRASSMASGNTIKLDGLTAANPTVELRQATATNYGTNYEVTNFGQINSGGGAFQNSVNNITLASGATVKVSPSSAATLAANSIILNGPGTAQTTTPFALGSISELVAGSSFTKSDVSTLTLSGVGGYSGGTVVAGGTLKLGASSTLPNTTSVDIGSTATFDVSAIPAFSLGAKALLGTGKVLGNIAAGGAVDPATHGTVGKLSVDGTLALDSTSTSTFDILAADSFDQLAQATSGKSVDMNGTINAVFNGTFAGTETFKIVDFSQYSGTPTFTYSGLDQNAMTASFDASTGIVALSAVPEPGSLALLAVGGLALLRRRRA
jgi:autotransporter-associated beta strand protein